MTSPKTPTPKTPLRISSEGKYTLDLMRALAAQMVLLGHIFGILGSSAALRDIAAVPVVVFFVLSGYLITHSAENLRHRGAGFRAFFISRFSRIFPPYLLCLCLIALVDVTIVRTGVFGAYEFAPQVTLKEFLGNIFMLQVRPVVGSVGRALLWEVNQFGSARPFWTISFEWWLYMSFGIVFFFRHQLGRPWILLALGICGAVPALNILSENEFSSGLTWVWLAGAGLYYLNRRWNPGWMSARTLLIMAGMFAMYVLVDYAANIKKFSMVDVYDLSFMVLLVLPVALMIIYSQWFPGRARRWVVAPRVVSFLASYSYSLYLIHFTVIVVVSQIMPDASIWISGACMVVSANLVAICVASVTEFRLHNIRDQMSRRWIS
ncbi:acyltransferase [Tropicibacter sp. Alg240-R139]|uniref:acyltransferase family protein n=1 Tax=Tropicibacter sp. Alg240-R139 TaxID=2305991 RepID=UPI0013DF4CA5|nr:acyltransferase [Tropicibacter sp. Alg240-R139]